MSFKLNRQLNTNQHSDRHRVLNETTQQIKAGLEANTFSAVLNHPSEKIFSPSSTAS